MCGRVGPRTAQAAPGWSSEDAHSRRQQVEETSGKHFVEEQPPQWCWQGQERNQKSVLFLGRKSQCEFS